MSKNKNNDIPFDYIGDWYVPGLSEKLEGYLRTKKKHLYLELFTENTFENQSLSEGVKVQYSNYQIIIGDSVRNGKCTLYKCTWAGCKQISERRYRLKYEVQFAFLNALIEDENKLLVRYADFSFSHLSSWYDGSKSTSRLSPHTGVFINGTEQPPDTQNKQKIVNVTENIDFVFIDSFERHEIQWGNSYENKFQKYLRIGFKEPVLFEELISIAAYFSNLLEVCLFRQVPFTVHNITFTEDAYSYLDNNPYSTITSSHVLNYSLSNWKTIVDGVMHQHHMLISRWKFDESTLDDIIRKWFSTLSFCLS